MRNLISLLTLFAAAAAGEAPSVRVRGETLRAGDLASAIPVWRRVDPVRAVARAPAPGATRRVPRAQLTRWAAEAGLDAPLESQPSDLTVIREMRRLEPAEVERRARAAFAERFGVSADDVEIELHGFAAPLVAAGEIDFEVEILGRRLNEPTRLHLRWSAPGGRSAIEVLSATPRVRGEYLAARADLRAGSTVSEADFERRSGYLPDGAVGAGREPDWGAKLSLRRPLKAGEPLPADALLVKPAVERGDLIELRLAAGAVRLRTPARAESSGSPGELISARNLASNRRVSAVVVEAGAAEALR